MKATALQESLKKSIKSLLKSKKKNYEELAVYLEVSVPTVKRILTKEELSLSRLLKICDYLEVSLSDLEKLAKHNHQNTEIYFTDKQDEFLAKNSHFLTFLLELYSRLSPQQIQKKYKLSSKSLELYLIKLDRLGLVRYSNNKCDLIHSQFPSWPKKGQLHKLQLNSILNSGYHFFKKYNTRLMIENNVSEYKQSRISMNLVEMSLDTYFEWMKKYDALINEFNYISEYERNLPQIKNKRNIILFHCHGHLADNDSDLDTIVNSFGQVIEIAK